MNESYIIKKETLEDIASAIREREASQGGILCREMAERIRALPIPANYGLISYDGFSLTVS